jgi:SAM-dependent methyltransferase
MEAEVYDSLYTHAESHWWNRSRKRIILSLLRRHARTGGRVLDLGCGVGTHLHALGEFGEVWGADPSDTALAYCRRHFPGRLDVIALPDAVPYEPATFDVVVMLDVLEHIEDDAAALSQVHKVLKPGGVFVMTVPALRWLWSAYDEHAHHWRRYHRGPLRALLAAAGFDVHLLSYTNCFLFPLMAASRLLMPATFWNEKDMVKRGNGRLIGPLFELIFSAERHVLPWLPLPVGGSLVAVATRPAAPPGSSRCAA